MALDNSKKTFDRTVALFKAGSLDEAEEVCRSITNRDPRDINFLSLLGSILLRKDNFEEAETVLRAVIKLAPEYPRAHEDLGTILLNLGKSEQALVPLQSAIELNPKSSSAFFKLRGALKILSLDEK